MPSPKRLPPKPVPRQLKMSQPDSDPVSEISDSEEDYHQEEGDMISIFQDMRQTSDLQDKDNSYYSE